MIPTHHADDAARGEAVQLMDCIWRTPGWCYMDGDEWLFLGGEHDLDEIISSPMGLAYLTADQPEPDLAATDDAPLFQGATP